MTKYEMVEISNHCKVIRIIDIDFDTNILHYEIIDRHAGGNNFEMSLKNFINRYFDNETTSYFYVVNPEIILDNYKKIQKLLYSNYFGGSLLLSKEDLEKLLTRHLVIKDVKEVNDRLFIMCKGDIQIPLDICLESFEKDGTFWIMYMENFEKLKSYINIEN